MGPIHPTTASAFDVILDSIAESIMQTNLDDYDFGDTNLRHHIFQEALTNLRQPHNEDLMFALEIALEDGYRWYFQWAVDFWYGKDTGFCKLVNWVSNRVLNHLIENL